MENDTNPIDGALSTRARCRVVVAPIPVYFPLGNNRGWWPWKHEEPEIEEDEGAHLIGIELYNYINAGVENGGHGNTREPEIEEDEGAHLIGIELYNYINAGAEDGGHGNTTDPEVDKGEGAHVIGIEPFHLIHFNN
ncbi:hypothetical protein GOBAR_AA00823 [Gossypium barbadense]|uniref:Uncharacterized protein n=1 Tax=Gossypium barbadense TaxID=3634 RepID=A0A2P5YVV8_GOSBA|nr:hypothetical protein GOBAR_AA00823 [Gossypium barbadense]